MRSNFSLNCMVEHENNDVIFPWRIDRKVDKLSISKDVFHA